MLSVIDRNSPIGKRDYAMILLACVLGLRIGDIKNLRFQNFNWEAKKLSLIQHKTHKTLTLPIPDAVGWAVIDYIKNGRPQYYETNHVFLKHMPSFDPIGNENHMQQQLVRYMRKAGIDQRTKKHSGFHSLRHSAGSMLLEMETPLPIITEIHNLIELKRALGFSYKSEAGSLRRIDTFLCENNLSEKCITKELCELWCQKRTYETVTNQASRISIMRVFCRYLNDIGIPSYVPPKGITHKRIRYDAHIYTDEELQNFFDAVDKSQSVPDSCPYRADVMPVFFKILYTSGMRVSELRLARIRDINLEEGYITVHEIKNHKERLIPIHPSLTTKCKELKEKIHSTSSDDEYFFMMKPGQPMTLVNV